VVLLARVDTGGHRPTPSMRAGTSGFSCNGLPGLMVAIPTVGRTTESRQARRIRILTEQPEYSILDEKIRCTIMCMSLDKRLPE